MKQAFGVERGCSRVASLVLICLATLMRMWCTVNEVVNSVVNCL